MSFADPVNTREQMNCDDIVKNFADLNNEKLQYKTQLNDTPLELAGDRQLLQTNIDQVDDELAIKTCKYHSYKYTIITPNDIVIPPKNDNLSKD